MNDPREQLASLLETLAIYALDSFQSDKHDRAREARALAAKVRAEKEVDSVQHCYGCSDRGEYINECPGITTSRMW